MSKKIEDGRSAAENEALEIIELTIEDIQLLSRAFRMITDVCEEMSDPVIGFEEAPPKIVLH